MHISQACESSDKNLNSDFLVSDFQTFSTWFLYKSIGANQISDLFSVVSAIFRFFSLMVLIFEYRFAICMFKKAKVRKKIYYWRVWGFFHKTVRVWHVYCNFKLGYTCKITGTLGTLKDRSLLSNIWFCNKQNNIFQNGVDALSEIVNVVLLETSKFCLYNLDF